MANKVEIEIRATDAASPVIKGVAGDMAAIAPAASKAQGSADGALNTITQKGKQAADATKTISEQLALVQRAYVALQATQGAQAIARDLAQTADAYNNLQARIKLATGEGVAFEAAFDGVSAIAQRTSSALESTGNLFTKLAESGKSAGLGTEAAIAQALALTETVNQAVQLSGASAGASDAAITQLIQGLQGGVLRGDEFNSVMEQSPRLAKALADGLGTTTGELRKMAEAGQLSSDVVIKALKGQADTVAAEFSKLPPTVGRALENLATSWTLYVGETDKATGASSLAASAISGLANNLSTIAGYLMDAGQAATAFAALKLAQHFSGMATAAAASATAVAANTTAIAAAGAAGTTAATSVGRFASILGGLKTFTLLGLVTNFQDIGIAIGEAAARLAGYKDRTDELARADKVSAQIAADNVAQRQRMAAATQAAIDKTFELSDVATAAIAEFDKLTKAGTSSAEAVAKIGKDFNLATVPGIRDAAAVLDKLAADGKISAETLQVAWVNALKGEDLARFEVQARQAFAGTAREAERLGQVVDAALRESIKRAGLDFDVISGGMSKASQSAINDTEAMISGLDRLKAMGVDTAAALTASLGQGIDTANTEKAIEAVRGQIEAVRKVLGDKIADGLLDQAAQKATALSDALDKAKPGINSLREAMKDLGVTSDQAFKDTAEKSKAAFDAMKASGTASARELADGFKRFAADAIAANGGVATETLKSEAAMRGLEIVTDRAGKAIVKAMGDGKRSTDDFRQSVQSSIGAINQQTSALEAQAQSAADRAKKLEGQNAVDNRLMFQVRDKLNAGTLTAEDTADVKNVLAALKQNAVVNAFGRSMGGISLAGIEDDIKWQNTGAVLQQFVDAQGRQTATPAGASPSQSAPSTGGKTYTVNVNLGGGTTPVNVASDADAQKLIDVLKRAQRSA